MGINTGSRRKSKLNDRALLNNLRDHITMPPTNTGTTEGDTHNNTPAYSGLFNNAVIEPKRNFIAAANNMLLTDSTQNAAIVIGTDRPSSVGSGYGGLGAQGANTIDIVVGRMASNPHLKDGAGVQNSFSGDAARIYISQLTDIDLNFGLEEGFSGPSVGRSAIGIKADAVRVIGREGVKIVSGRSFAFKGHGMFGEQNARGGKIHQPAPPIELIAGNIKEEASLFGFGPTKRHLQGVAKGENVRDAFRDLASVLDDVQGALSALAQVLTITCSAAAITPIPSQAAAFAASSAIISSLILPAGHQARTTKTLWGINFTDPSGDKYVVSRNVYST